jgi:propanediol dehydratase large subunit
VEGVDVSPIKLALAARIHQDLSRQIVRHSVSPGGTASRIYPMLLCCQNLPASERTSAHISAATSKLEEILQQVDRLEALSISINVSEARARLSLRQRAKSKGAQLRSLSDKCSDHPADTSREELAALLASVRDDPCNEDLGEEIAYAEQALAKCVAVLSLKALLVRVHHSEAESSINICVICMSSTLSKTSM